jgi:hydrogenase maturation protease
MIRVISIGNILRGDDGIGPVILEELHRIDFPTSVDLYDTGSDAFTVLDHLVFSDNLIIIDCAKMGKQPGKVLKFNLNHSNMHVVENSVSLHGIGFGEIYMMAKRLGQVADCTVIGIEPKHIAFNSTISHEVQECIPLVIQMVIEEIKTYAKKDINH